MADKVLVIGSGAREHVIAQTLLKGKSVEEVYCAPGNPGMLADGIQVVHLAQTNHAAIIRFAQDKGVDWVFVGPENPLMEGLVDDLEEAGIKAFGPSRAAAQIEGSKTFAKELMGRHQVPTARYAHFDDLEASLAYVEREGAPIVVKADGLAAGKGVTVAMDVETAEAALRDIFVDNKFGSAGSSVVIEEFLQGQEFSLMSFVKGGRFWTMPISQDHKRACDGDKGPNTGGMGAYCPVPQISEQTVRTAVATIIRPVVEGMEAEGTPFTGVLYAGLIATADGPKVIEFNARFGDPEAEVILPRLTSDFGAAIKAILTDQEPQFTWEPADKVTLGVVLASEGYPEKPRTGSPLPPLQEAIDQAGLADSTHIYYAGAALSDIDQAGDPQAGLVSSSGRVLLVETTADTIPEARERIYSLLDSHQAEGFFYRHDIGSKALQE
ncbi:phosphoribosylamine--glycine ligase [Parascardovia denticolens IPLA 20019]|uniref:phosphoribosylamine--glycine ligase n=1 Tax=Parascardovia denticolens TaxID=78258 RepID=UPI000266D2DC|nr:phosphoribosylamine--glycine ligase [Parascardovia denticolens]EIT88397.1 phosphoribosylamine--glycine ligase [Parascardovia denticolens IPLA 20019]